jgi:hypothetical protein
MTSDETSKKQESYAKLRLAWQLEIAATSSILEVLRNLLSSSLTDLQLVGRGTSTDKENRDRIRRHPRTPEPLVILSQPLIVTYKKRASSPTTSTPSPIPTEDGDATTSKQELLQLQGGSLADRLPGTQD